MKRLILYVVIVILFFGCRTNVLIPYNTTQEIKILNIDEVKFEYQISFKFITKNRNIGFLFIDKKEKNTIEYLKSIKGKYSKIELCQVHSIRVEEDLYLKSNRVFVSVNDEENPENKYYSICYEQFQKIKNGL